MSDSKFMRSCAEAVVRDVVDTTSLSVELSIYDDPDNGIGAVVHEAGTHPAMPVWEAIEYLDGGDSLAIHPPSKPTEMWPDSGSRTEVTSDIVNAAQNLVQVLLWKQCLDPNWPACPEHGRHPLYVRERRDLTATSDGMSFLGETDSAARWECPEGTTSIPIGSLHPPQA